MTFIWANLLNCDGHVLLYTGVPMNFGQDCLYAGASDTLFNVAAVYDLGSVKPVLKTGLGQHTLPKLLAYAIIDELFTQLR